MTKRAIPTVPLPQQPRQQFDAAVKEDLEIIMGHRGVRIKELPATATPDDVIAKVNELIARLQ